MGGFLQISAVLLILIFGLSRGSDAQESQEKLTVLLRSGSTVFVSDDRDNPEGFDVDLLERFVAWNKNRKGQKIVYIRAFVETMSELLHHAEAGRCDIALGSVTATEERDQRVDFSTPYLPVRTVLIAPEGRVPPGSYDQILVGKTVGAIAGSTSEEQVKRLAREVPNLKAKTNYARNDELFAALLQKPPEIDAVVTDITHYWDLNRRENLVLIDTLGPTQGLAFVFPEGSPLKEQVDAFLEEFLHSQSYFTLVRHYFGQRADEMIRSARQN